MRLLALDIETTGLDPAQHAIIEVGAAIWDTYRGSVLWTYGTLCRPRDGVEMTAETAKLTGIEAQDIAEFGRDLPNVLAEVAGDALAARVEYLVGHNARAFDEPFLLAEIARFVAVPEPLTEMMRRPWVDTMVDLPPDFGTGGASLLTTAAAHGFLNPFPHRALFDALTCLKIISRYDWNKLLTYARTPIVRLLAWGLPFDRKDEAKTAGFRWDPALKVWFKDVRVTEADAVVAGLTFEVRRKELPK